MVVAVVMTFFGAMTGMLRLVAGKNYVSMYVDLAAAFLRADAPVCVAHSARCPAQTAGAQSKDCVVERT